MVVENVTLGITAAATSGWTVQETLSYVLLSIILGMVGQFIRVGIGLKKEFESSGGKFELNKLVGSLLIAAVVGATAGVLYIAALQAQLYTIGPLDKTFFLTLISVGYAGTDFIEGLMTRQPIPIEWTTKLRVQNECQQNLNAIEAGKFDTNVLKMEVVKKV